MLIEFQNLDFISVTSEDEDIDAFKNTLKIKIMESYIQSHMVLNLNVIKNYINEAGIKLFEGHLSLLIFLVFYAVANIHLKASSHFEIEAMITLNRKCGQQKLLLRRLKFISYFNRP